MQIAGQALSPSTHVWPQNAALLAKRAGKPSDLVHLPEKVTATEKAVQLQKTHTHTHVHMWVGIGQCICEGCSEPAVESQKEFEGSF